MAILIFFTLVSCDQEPGKVFPLSSGDAQGILKMSKLPRETFATFAREFRLDGSGPSEVAWVMSGPLPTPVRFVATLTPVSAESTRVRVDFQGSPGMSPAAAQKFTIAMEEVVAAALEKRDPNPLKTVPAIVAAGLGNAVGMMNAMSKAQDDMKDYGHQQVEKAYAEERAGLRR